MNVTWGYLVGVGFGVPITYLWSIYLHWLLKKRFPNASSESTERVLWIPMLTGIFERAIVLTLLFWLPPATGAFAGAWIAIKAAGGWGSLREPTSFGRAIYAIGLLGSAFSILWALGVGIWVTTHPSS